jgi:hypothetical protein
MRRRIGELFDTFHLGDLLRGVLLSYRRDTSNRRVSSLEELAAKRFIFGELRLPEAFDWIDFVKMMCSLFQVQSNVSYSVVK